jgi:hypothetical protein
MPCNRELVLVGKHVSGDICIEEPGRDAREAKIWLWTRSTAGPTVEVAERKEEGLNQEHD